ncbi:MAG TPA: 3-phosphoshikimate 1-carboxyvinyltransferase [Acidimicrobiales bacterium]|nr:3-phosphoshikimate 1-carboxyvinyltransferase [Acidimicrobiales bacterium]
MSVLEVRGGRPLKGRVRVPGDKSISHRALLLAALAEGTSLVTGLADGDDVARTAGALRLLGAGVDLAAPGGGGAGGATATVSGGRDRLHEHAVALDLGNSGTGLRLLAGVCASLPWTTTLTGDESLSRRPMDRVAVPLRLMGAHVEGTGDDLCPPLTVRGGGLRGIEYELPVPSAQVKGAVLLAGLGAEGDTVVREHVVTRAHTEELLAAVGADVVVSADRLETRVRASKLEPFRLDVPGDPSQAAFWVVAACITPGSDVVVEHVYVGQARADFLDVLRRMGAPVDVAIGADGTADIHARYGPLRGTHVGGAEVPGLIDEIPALAVAAAVAEGVTTFADAGELRVKETDRVAALAHGLAGLGVHAEERPDGLVVAGGASLGAGAVHSHGDHRIAMAMAVAGMALPDGGGPVRIDGWESVDTSYPGFEADLRLLCR